MQTKNGGEGVNFLKDTYIDKKTGRVKDRNWKGRKKASLLMSESYKRIGDISKGVRMGQCSSYMAYKKYSEHDRKLKDANFCRCRLCPMCMWRRSRKVYQQVAKIMDYLEEHKEYKYIFLTVTFRNMVGEDLPKAIDAFMESFKRMTNSKEFKKAAKGFFRALEVRKKYDREDYHPHIHVIIAVDKRYFEKKDKQSGYMNHDEWMSLWRRCAKLDYDPWVDIRKVKEKVEKIKNENGEIEKVKSVKGAVAEVSKYCTKSTDIIIDVDEVYFHGSSESDKGKYYKNRRNGRELYESFKKEFEDYADKILPVMDMALKGRRLVSFGGIFKEVHKLLNLDNPEDGDLIHESDEIPREDLDYIVETYVWSYGYKNYIQIHPETESEEMHSEGLCN
jgi:plasmid rolling circle replication initiator protein Rep